MARRTGLTLLAAAVVAAHIVLLDWLARELQADPLLQQMAPTMFTRTLQQQDPPPPAPAAAPRPRVPRKRAPPAEGTMAASLPAPSVPAEATKTVASEEPPAPTQPVASAPAAPASQPAVAAAAPASAASAPARAGGDWPPDTRLSYRLTGQFREGPLFGDARVQWQRDGDDYQVKLDIDITPWVTIAATSQGRVTDAGLMPRAYAEVQRNRRRAAEFGEQSIALDGGRSAPRPDGVQDTVSQFVELAHRFTSGREALEVGRSVSFWLARPGGVDLWTYDIIERETLQTAQLGAIEAWHMKPRPLVNPRGNITAEMWFAPSLQYLPVRIRVNVGEAWVDLMVDKIEQR